MTQQGSDTPLIDPRASRRQFFKFLAASPLAALAYSAVPSSWLEPLAGEAPPPRGPAALPCANCGAPVLPPLYDPPETRAVLELSPQQVPQELAVSRRPRASSTISSCRSRSSQRGWYTGR